MLAGITTINSALKPLYWSTVILFYNYKSQLLFSATVFRCFSFTCVLYKWDLTRRTPLMLSHFDSRSFRPEVFCEKGVLKNYAKFTGKHLWYNLYFNQVAGLRSANLLKKRLWHRCFPEIHAAFNHYCSSQ